MKFRLLPPAVSELRAAARYYELQIPGLGHDFLAEVRATILRISHSMRKFAAVAPIVSLTASSTQWKKVKCWSSP
jgi:hypothetical protein